MPSGLVESEIVLGFDHEISSDLEWMLQSGHATPDSLLEVLAPEFYPGLYRLALAWLGEAGAARQAAREALVQAVLHVHAYRHEQGARAWMYRQGVVVCRRLTPRRKPASRSGALPALENQEPSDQPASWLSRITW